MPPHQIARRNQFTEVTGPGIHGSVSAWRANEAWASSPVLSPLFYRMTNRIGVTWAAPRASNNQPAENNF
jgi:hypothetical protein